MSFRQCWKTIQQVSFPNSENFKYYFDFRLDYSGITMLIVGSFVPWIYYGFYCRAVAMTIYISMITILGIMALIVSLWDKFAEPTFRPLRAIVFVCMGLSSIVPAAHMLITDGLRYMFQYASLHWLLLMGFFYLTGAALYATRFPERFFPGKCDYIVSLYTVYRNIVTFSVPIPSTLPYICRSCCIRSFPWNM